MLKEKQKLIKRYGISVTVTSMAGAAQETVCLFGRATKQFNNTISLEYHRRAHFLPSVPIESGCLIHLNASNEDYIVIATFDEILDGLVASSIAHMFKCNASVTISADKMTADNRGNLKSVSVVKYENLKVYCQAVTHDLLEKKPGLFEEVEYLLYVPDIDVSSLNRVTLNLGGRQVPLKVKSVDYASYPGLACISVASETRK